MSSRSQGTSNYIKMVWVCPSVIYGKLWKANQKLIRSWPFKMLLTPFSLLAGVIFSLLIVFVFLLFLPTCFFTEPLQILLLWLYVHVCLFLTVTSSFFFIHSFTEVLSCYFASCFFSWIFSVIFHRFLLVFIDVIKGICLCFHYRRISVHPSQ